MPELPNLFPHTQETYLCIRPSLAFGLWVVGAYSRLRHIYLLLDKGTNPQRKYPASTVDPIYFSNILTIIWTVFIDCFFLPNVSSAAGFFCDRLLKKKDCDFRSECMFVVWCVCPLKSVLIYLENKKKIMSSPVGSKLSKMNFHHYQIKSTQLKFNFWNTQVFGKVGYAIQPLLCAWITTTVMFNSISTGFIKQKIKVYTETIFHDSLFWNQKLAH